MFSLQDLWQAYISCRRRKRGTRDAQRFDQALIDQLVEIRQALADRQWRPRRANWFVTTRPKAREVHCADFADRVVHHWLVPRLESLFEPVFIHDSHSNRVGHGVHHAVDRLQGHLRSQWRWFRHHWPECLVLMQVGNQFECYEDQASVLAELRGQKARWIDRPPFRQALGAGLGGLAGLRRALRRQSVAHAFIAEQGYLASGLKRRVLRLAWWPAAIAPEI